MKLKQILYKLINEESDNFIEVMYISMMNQKYSSRNEFKIFKSYFKKINNKWKMSQNKINYEEIPENDKVNYFYFNKKIYERFKEGKYEIESLQKKIKEFMSILKDEEQIKKLKYDYNKKIQFVWNNLTKFYTNYFLKRFNYKN